MLFSGCSGASLTDPSVETAEPAETIAAAEKAIPAIAHPLTRAEVEAIPVARAGMTEDELRAICVRYMQMMKSIPWTPDGDIRYDNPPAVANREDGTVSLPAGTIYGGMPYTSAGGDLLCFMDYYDEETGVLKVSGLGLGINNILGNTCSPCTFWGWARVSTTMVLDDISRINPSGGYVALGPAQYDFDKPFTDTPTITRENGEQIMYQCYALLKPASGLVTYPKGTYGHTRMSVETPTVVYKEDGTIDGDKSTVRLSDQTPNTRNVTDENGKVTYIGNVDTPFTFRALYDSGYLTFEIPELVGQAPVEEAEVTLVLPNDDPARFFEGKITANYAISRVDAFLLDENGNETELGHALGNCYGERARVISVTTAASQRSLSRLVPKGESCRIAFRVRLGNGETFTLDPVTVTP